MNKGMNENYLPLHNTRREKQITLIKHTEKDIFSLLLIDAMFNIHDHITKNDDDNNKCK